MKKITKITITQVFLFVLLLIFASSGFCGDSLNIQVSCTIPAIPGVNAPLLISETKITEVKKTEYALQNDQQNTQQQPPLPMIQEDAQKKDTSEKETNLTMLVKTLYPR